MINPFETDCWSHFLKLRYLEIFLCGCAGFVWCCCNCLSRKMQTIITRRQKTLAVLKVSATELFRPWCRTAHYPHRSGLAPYGAQSVYSHHRAPGLDLLQVLVSALGGHIFILFQLKVHPKRLSPLPQLARSARLGKSQMYIPYALDCGSR